MNTKRTNTNGSCQLEVGQRFHYQGKNGVTYFSLEVEQASDGSVFPKTVTAPACNALPVECDGDGKIIAVYLLLQEGRPEASDGNPALKATGSFCGVSESGQDCAIRSLSDKLAIVARQEDLIYTGESYGFGFQFRFPIELFIVKEFGFSGAPLSVGCTRVRYSLEDVANAQAQRKFFNSETIDLIATVLLRNEYRSMYTW